MRPSYPLDGGVGERVGAVDALVDGLVELLDADALAEVEAGAGGRPRRRLQARLPVAAREPRLVLEAAVVAALELVGEAVARDPPLRHRLVDAQRGRVGQPL